MELHEERVIRGDLAEVWRIATDVAGWPEWDPHEESGEIYGPFEAGTRAMSKPRGGPVAHWELVEVDPQRSWALRNAMAIGTLEVRNTYEALPEGRVRCTKTMRVSGIILRLLFRLHFAKATRADMQATWGALEQVMAKGPVGESDCS